MQTLKGSQGPFLLQLPLHACIDVLQPRGQRARHQHADTDNTTACKASASQPHHREKTAAARLFADERSASHAALPRARAQPRSHSLLLQAGTLLPAGHLTSAGPTPSSSALSRGQRTIPGEGPGSKRCLLVQARGSPSISTTCATAFRHFGRPRGLLYKQSLPPVGSWGHSSVRRATLA